MTKAQTEVAARTLFGSSSMRTKNTSCTYMISGIMKKNSTRAYSMVGSMIASFAPSRRTTGPVNSSPASISTLPQMSIWIVEAENQQSASFRSPSPKKWAYSVAAPEEMSMASVLTSMYTGMHSSTTASMDGPRK